MKKALILTVSLAALTCFTYTSCSKQAPQKKFTVGVVNPNKGTRAISLGFIDGLKEFSAAKGNAVTVIESELQGKNDIDGFAAGEELHVCELGIVEEGLEERIARGAVADAGVFIVGVVGALDKADVGFLVVGGEGVVDGLGVALGTAIEEGDEEDEQQDGEGIGCDAEGL